MVDARANQNRHLSLSLSPSIALSKLEVESAVFPSKPNLGPRYTTASVKGQSQIGSSDLIQQIFQELAQLLVSAVLN